MTVAQIDSKKSWNAKVYDLDDKKTEITIKDSNTRKWNISSSAVTFTKNIELPLSMTNNLDNKMIKFNDIIFRCGGVDNILNGIDYSGALIIDSYQFHGNKSQDIIAYNWTLPKFPCNIRYNSILYSHAQNGLFCVGGYNDHHEELDTIYKLSFDINDDVYSSQNIQEWNWKKLEIKLRECRQSASFALINNSTHIICISGYAAGIYKKSVELIDLNINVNHDKQIETNKMLKSCNKGRLDGGIYYDEINELIYIGGGFNDRIDTQSFNSVECYDLEKNIWSNLPDTKLKHDMNPLLWIEDNNLLHIMSVMSNGVEYIDLRQDSKQWDIKINNLDQLFNVKFDIKDDVSKCRIVGN